MLLFNYLTSPGIPNDIIFHGPFFYYQLLPGLHCGVETVVDVEHSSADFSPGADSAEPVFFHY
jgi:hypothetical protein